MKTLLLCAATLILALSSPAQTPVPQEEVLILEKAIHLGPAAPDLRVSGHRLFRRPSGNGFVISYIVAGTMATRHVMVLDSSGNTEWSKIYPAGMRAQRERANAVVELGNGDIAVATAETLAVERLDANGGLVWREELFPASSVQPGGYLFNADQTLQLSDSSLAVIGSKLGLANTNVNQDLALARLASNGRLLWKTLAGGEGPELGRAVAELPDQSLIFGGISHSPVSGNKTAPHYGEADIWVAKYASNGARIWDMSFGGSSMEDLVAIRTNLHGIVLFGTSLSGVSGNKSAASLGGNDIWVVQLDHSGALLSDIALGTSRDDELVEVFELQDGGWLLHTRSPAPGEPTGIYVLNNDLSERWRRSISYGGVTPTSTGTIRWFGHGPTTNFEHINFSPDGAVLTRQDIPPPPDGVIAAFNGRGRLIEVGASDYLSTDFAHILVLRSRPQRPGLPFFFTREVGNLRWVEVTIQSTFPNGSIFYTLDNTAPTRNSTRYTGAFHLQNSAQVRAIAYNADFSESVTNSIDVVVNAIQVRSLRVDPGVMGVVRFEGPVWNGSGETQATTLITNATSLPRVLMAGRTAQLTALPASGTEFIRWEGAVSSTNLTVQVVMDTDKQLRAHFGTQLHVPAPAHGEVVVDGLPGRRLVPFGPITLQAIPNTGYYFSGWGGTASGSANPLALTVTSTYPSASATFLPLGANEAAPTAIVLGPGSVSLTPRKNVYAVGEPIVLRAEPTPGAMFIGWIGATNTASPELSVTATGSERYTALFAGPAQDGFVTALPASAGATILTSTNLVDWTSAQNVTTTHGANLIIDPAPLSRARYYRLSSQ